MTIAANHRCSYCTPGRELGKDRCGECLAVYAMHLAAEKDIEIERIATAWIYEAAPKLRYQIKMPTECDDALAEDGTDDRILHLL